MNTVDEMWFLLPDKHSQFKVTPVLSRRVEIKIHILNLGRSVEIKIHTFLIWTVDGSDWSASQFERLYTGNICNRPTH
jgi:hypothetical protein